MIPQAADIKDDIPTLVRGVLRDTFQSGPFKAFYDGDPDVIPRSSLPAICVVQMEDTNRLGPTQHDTVTTTLQIRVVFNKEDDWKTNSDRQDLTDAKIRRIIGARDKDSGEYLPTTVKGALNQNYTLGGATLQQEMGFELNTVPRAPDLVTREGHLNISYEEYVPVTNRA